MKRRMQKLGIFFLAAAVVILLGPAVFAETHYGSTDWEIKFTDKLEENFGSGDIADLFAEVQPGDTVVITINLRNMNVKTTDWYMRNDVISSMEDGSNVAEGGAYTYKLRYKDKDGKEKVLFDSVVGGDNSNAGGEGLHGATGALKDYFYLDTLATNKSGSVTLEITTDGESQTVDYQNVAADMLMSFAVELNTPNTPNSNRTQVVRTGDETRLLPLYIAMAVSGLVLLVLGIFTLRRDKRKRGG